MKTAIIGGWLAVACSAAWGSAISFSSVDVTVDVGKPDALGAAGVTDAIVPQFANSFYYAAGEACVQGSCSVQTPALNVLGALRLTNTYVNCVTGSDCGGFSVGYEANGQVTGPVNVFLLMDNINWDVGDQLVQGIFTANIAVNGVQIKTLTLNFDSSDTTFGPTPSFLIGGSGTLFVSGILHFDSMPGNDFMGLPDSGIVEFTGASTPGGTPEPATVWIVLAAFGGLAARRLSQRQAR